MSKPSLAQLLAESARAVEAERAHNAHADRITAAVKEELAKRAETSKEYPQCPNCGQVLEGWRTDDVTGDSTTNQDEDNEGDRPDVDDNDDVEELDAGGKSKVVAQLLANHKRRR